MDHTHPDAFKDMEVREQPNSVTTTYEIPGKDGKETIKCPKCKGHGGWNLALDQYKPIDGYSGSQHFRASCDQCWGWGWVDKDGPDAECIHTFKEVPFKGRMHDHKIVCTKCKRERIYDSSG